MESIVVQPLEMWKKHNSYSEFADLETNLKEVNSWIKQGKALVEERTNTFNSLQKSRQLSFQYQKEIADTRGKLISRFGQEIYGALTDQWQKHIRVEELIFLIAEKYPGLAPGRAEIEEDAQLKLPHKKGVEVSQGVILSELLADKKIGRHLIASMRLPTREATNCLVEFKVTGEKQFETIRLERKGNTGYITLSNRSCLNAEDYLLMQEMEVAVDLILMDPTIEVAVLRGDVMQHKKYEGKRVFCSGVNLTKLYHGQLPFLFYVCRELGLMNKIYRGLFSKQFHWDHDVDNGIEKPWISVVDTHAIGGGCQLMLVTDYVLAAADAYFTIPARTEGFIPGLANMRLPRFTGQTLARNMINMNYKVLADSQEGALLVDEVQPSEQIDPAISRIVDQISASGVKGMISNKKAFRCGVEPLETFRTYMAMFSQQQAHCMYDDEIIENLEQFWMKK